MTPELSTAPSQARTLQPSSAPPIDSAIPSLGWPIALIGLLAVAALVLKRRRQGQGQWVKLLETTNLGPKRSLVVVQLGTETVLLGTSEAGIVLLKSGLQRPAPAPVAHLVPEPPGMLKKELNGAQAFDELLAESVEDQELRQKLSDGLRARVS